MSWDWPELERRPALDEPTVPPPTNPREDEGADICIIVDNSGSTAGTDPNGSRHVAFRRILNLLADGIAGDAVDDRVAVVCFAENPYAYCPLTSVRSRKGRRRLRQFLRPVSAGGTAIVPAIRRAGQLARPHGERPVVHLLFTDGESNEGTAALNRSIDRQPVGSVHVVVLGAELPPQWDGARVGSVTPIEQLNGPEDLEWAMARALYRSLDLQWPNPSEAKAAR